MSTILSTMAFFLKSMITIVECSQEHGIEAEQARFELSVGEPLETWDFEKQPAVLEIRLEAVVPVDWAQCVLNSV